jgi:hypothetical protein
MARQKEFLRLCMGGTRDAFLSSSRRPIRGEMRTTYENNEIIIPHAKSFVCGSVI